MDNPVNLLIRSRVTLQSGSSSLSLRLREDTNLRCFAKFSWCWGRGSLLGTSRVPSVMRLIMTANHKFPECSSGRHASCAAIPAGIGHDAIAVLYKDAGRRRDPWLCRRYLWLFRYATCVPSLQNLSGQTWTAVHDLPEWVRSPVPSAVTWFRNFSLTLTWRNPWG